MNFNIRTLDKTPEINNYLTVRNCYKSTRIESKSTSIGNFHWVSRLVLGISRLHKTDTDMQVSGNYN